MARRAVWLNLEEQAVLDQVRVRLIEPDEKLRWDDLIATRHYLKNATLVGEQLRYVAEHDGQWLALSSSTGELTPTVKAVALAPPGVWKPMVALPPRMPTHPLMPE